MKKFSILLGALFIMQTIIGYNASASDIVWTKQTHDVYYIQFSPDSKLIATNNNGQVLIHDVETQETLFEYGPIYQTRFTTDGKYLVGFNNSSKLILIDLATKQMRDNIQNAPANIRAYDFSRDGKKIIATYSFMYEYSIWDIESGQIERTVKIPIVDSANTLWQTIQSIDYGKDDKTVIMMGLRAYHQDKTPGYYTLSTIHIVETETGEEKLQVNKGGILTSSNDGSLMAEVLGNTNKIAFRVVNVNTWNEILSISGFYQNISSIGQITFSPDDKFVIAGYSGEVYKVILYELSTGKEAYNYNIGTIYAVDASKDGKFIAAGNGERLILLNAHYGSTSVKENESISDILSFPNPTNSNSVTVEFNLSNSSVTKIQLYDLSGRIVKNIDNQFLEAGNHNLEIDISNLSIGQYNLSIETSTGITSHKIIVSR